ncbi:MAG TPA: hypothetical protein VI816_01330, partial [Candidatus Bathyarchaeia archaeon]|nr:hypothetical protein [Candidatus Bathyarchaeia archaeon]
FKAGFGEIGDVFVVNKADLVNPSKTMFNIASGLKEKDGWRPLVLKTIALKGTGIPALVDALDKFRGYLEKHGLREKRLRGMVESELVEAAFSDFYTETLPRLKNHREWDRLVHLVVKREVDPETAALKLVKTIAKLGA